MTIFVNDIKYNFSREHTVATLLNEMRIPEKGTAVALNNRIVRRDHWTDRKLEDGDKLLIIKAAYGG